MSYHVRHETPAAADYVRIRKAAGLSGKSQEAAVRGLPNSLFAVTVRHDGEVVGMGRVIGDGGCFFEVVDIAVMPAHQGKGVGRSIMREILGFIEANWVPGTYVSLITSDPDFYTRFGFKLTAPDDGMYLHYRAD